MRRPIRHLIVGILALLATSASALAETPWRKLPWHLVDYFYRFEASQGFRSLAIEVDVRGNAKEGDFIYLSPLWGKIGGTGFYFGLQTDVQDRRVKRYIGKGVIYSRWDSTTRADARAAPGGWVDALDDARSGEGDFVGVRLPYAWGEGAYNFLLLARPIANGGGWVDLVFFDHAAGRWVDAGGLRFPSLNGFYERPASFLEIYAYPLGPQFPDRYVVPNMEIKIGTPLLNQTLRPLDAKPRIGERIPHLLAITPNQDGLRLKTLYDRIPAK